eukprot:TRINITY_DN4856_c0_g1_i2.p2 TRINITY_DN4856_c0_g1~~TRINITY_DN4856_c0_g1_i2.p2  ORF type:complete len:207 (-),score=40.25 TRINITY_DN4856_c0_g1_i2:92-712(-)
MCGNGARCVALYAHHRRWTLEGCNRLVNDDEMVQSFKITETSEGVSAVQVSMEPFAIIETPSPCLFMKVIGPESRFPNFFYEGFYTVGVPHLLFSCDDVPSPVPIGEAMREVMDVNVNIFRRISDGDPTMAFVRTYERGVYGETMACGSGCCAVAYHLWLKEGKREETEFLLKVLSGMFVKVRITCDGGIFLSGPARMVFEGVMDL